MKFSVLFEREVHTRETVTREVEADNLEAARDEAFRMSLEFDKSAPADRQLDACTDHDCTDWTYTVEG